jgi:hypothetical protein
MVDPFSYALALMRGAADRPLQSRVHLLLRWHSRHHSRFVGVCIHLFAARSYPPPRNGSMALVSDTPSALGSTLPLARRQRGWLESYLRAAAFTLQKVGFRSHIGFMEPKYVDWEDVPARWLPGEAWAFIDGAWKRVHSSDVANNGAELEKSSFEATFGRLIALPAIAFQDLPDR